MLKHISIENYRSCLDTSIDLHPNLSVLIGPNGSGKTNILQGLMLLNKIAAEDRLVRRIEGPITTSSQITAVFQDGRRSARLRASVDTRADESNNDSVRGSKQRWTITAKGKRATTDVSLASARRGDRLMMRWYAGHPSSPMRFSPEPAHVPLWAARTLTRLWTFCNGMKYYSASQFTNPGSCPVSFEIEGEGDVHRAIRLRGHAKLLFEIYSASKVSTNSRYEQFIDIVGRKGLGLISDLTFKEVPTSSIDHSVRVGGKIEMRRRRKLLVVPQFRIGKQRLSPNQLSEGTFKTLALLFNVITTDSTALLIEEPEVCVHHGLLASILELIKSYSEQKQMIVSTHSDYVLDHVAPENVFRVMFDRTLGTKAQYVPKSMSSRELAALRVYLEREGNLGEFWREGGFGDRP
jgi:ABC-type lipoprotein export system ATPase subunit